MCRLLYIKALHEPMPICCKFDDEKQNVNEIDEYKNTVP